MAKTTKAPLKLLVTGGAGFIGSEFVRQAVAFGFKTVVLDKLTYCGDLARLASVKRQIKFIKGDISDKKAVARVLSKEKPSIIANFAAETHVDRSIADASPFIDTNVKGTQVLLDACLSYPVQRFLHVSTDEVYGDIARGSFTETSPLNPSSPYSSSKASADLLIRSYRRTFGIPCVIVRPSNNYGPWQYPEKLIPVVIRQALRNKKIPVYAQGKNTREWLFVSDCCRGIMTAMLQGMEGEIYNIGSGHERRNIDVVMAILMLLRKPGSLVTYVQDRPGHDFRYSLDSRRIRSLGWEPQVSFDEGLRLCVEWYTANKKWMESKK